MIGGWTIGGVALGSTIATTVPTITGADVITETFTILGASYDRRVATLTLGPPNFTKIKVPWRRWHRDRCAWNYTSRYQPGSPCGYPSDQFDEGTEQDLLARAETDGAEEQRFGWYALNATKASIFDVNLAQLAELSIATTRTDVEWGGGRHQAPFLFKEFTGDFEVYTQILCESTVDGSMAGLLCQDRTGYQSTWFFVGLGQAVTGEIQPIGKSCQSGIVQAGWSAAVTDTYVKMKRVGTTFTAYHSADAVTWTSLGSDALSIDDDTRLGLVLSKPINATGTVAATFTTFQFVSGGPTECERTFAACSAYKNVHRFGAYPGIPR